jgi:hypothetical protein
MRQKYTAAKPVETARQIVVQAPEAKGSNNEQ